MQGGCCRVRGCFLQLGLSWHRELATARLSVIQSLFAGRSVRPMQGGCCRVRRRASVEEETSSARNCPAKLAISDCRLTAMLVQLGWAGLPKWALALAKGGA